MTSVSTTTTMTAPIIVVAGPTASGKSALAVDLAEKIGGEIVCADSRQIYAGMPIASAGPSAADEKRVKHHLYGSVTPSTTTFTAQAFCDAADTAVAAIVARKKIAILVGGTGLYLRAWRIGLDDKDLPDEERDMAAMLKREPRPIAKDARFLYVDAELDWLEPRIKARVERMFDAGIVDEALALRTMLGRGHRLLGTLGIEEALHFHDGVIGRDEAVRRTTLRTRQYARRQRTWFKKESWWARAAPDAGSLSIEA